MRVVSSLSNSLCFCCSILYHCVRSLKWERKFSVKTASIRFNDVFGLSWIRSTHYALDCHSHLHAVFVQCASVFAMCEHRELNQDLASALFIMFRCVFFVWYSWSYFTLCLCLFSPCIWWRTISWSICLLFKFPAIHAQLRSLRFICVFDFPCLFNSSSN